MRADRSTLLTSPLSLADFVFRVAFFAVAPFAIVRAAELFPVTGVLADAAVGLGVFVAGEAVRKYAAQHKLAKWLLSGALEFETYYRARMPRPFLYYLFYPLLFPYWLLNRDARQEFWMFRGYTVGGVAILVANVTWQYFRSWSPELDLVDYLPTVLITLAVETALVLALLMPIATTVVWYHASFRRGRLAAVLIVGLIATGIVIGRAIHQRTPIVSYATRTRVTLRTKAATAVARTTLLAAARAAWPATRSLRRGDREGLITGDALDVAHQALESFYKSDEAYAFELWGMPRREPSVLVLYFPARRRDPPIWVAIHADGSAITDPGALPAGARTAMHLASR